MDTGLQDRIVLITGASGGIGGATARAFSREGTKLILHYHSNEAAATALRDSIETESIAVGADLRNEAGVSDLFEAAIERFGRVDCLIANAGIWPEEETPLADMSLDRWRETIESDLTSAFLTCRAFTGHLRDQRRESASIVLIGSTAALFGEANHADYAAAKAGMVYGLTRSLKNEIVQFAPRGRVNAVCPGWTVTPMTESQLQDAPLVQRVTSTMPLKKVATADDIAAAVVFLASDRLAGHITGAILPVAGGMEGRLLSRHR